MTYQKKENVRKERIIRKILYIYENSKGIYGAPKIWECLKRMNEHTSIKTIQTYMRELQIKSITKRSFKIRRRKLSEAELLKLKNVAKEVVVDDINKVWVSDITYIHTLNSGWVYLSSIIDLYSRKVISYKVSKIMDTKLVISVLKNAIKYRKPENKVVIHSDKGTQYRSREYIKFCEKNNLIRSYTRVKFSCADNACQESFHAQLKKEFLYQRKIVDYDDARKLVYLYIETFYNKRRIHSSINYMTPDEYEYKNIQKVN